MGKIASRAHGRYKIAARARKVKAEVAPRARARKVKAEVASRYSGI